MIQLIINPTDKFFLRCIAYLPKNKLIRKNYLLHNTKLGWYDLFNRKNILTPKIYAIYESGKLEILDKSFNKNTKYIIKPKYGIKGSNISYNSFNNFIKTIKIKDTILFQERIYDCKNKEIPQFIRYISVYNKKLKKALPLIWRINTGKKNGEIAGNRKNASIHYNCNSLRCSKLSNQDKIHLENISKKLNNLHEQEFSLLENIGWDIIIACNGAYVLEGNLCHGTPLQNFFQKKYKLLLDNL